MTFKLLYLGDDSGIRDSSKNLRVLWTRALLASMGYIKDDVAYELLPKLTRGVVGPASVPLWGGTHPDVMGKLDWIVNRTRFIDASLASFLAETAEAPERQVIVIGAGYDTRCLRNRQAGVQFFEVFPVSQFS